MSYISFAFLSAFFAALTSVLAKYGMKKVNSNLATALRTIVVLVFSWLMVFLTTDITREFSRLTDRSLLYLILSGLTTGASWLCYFHALKIGNVNVVVPIDKSSIVFTIVLSSVILKEHFGLFSGICTLLIAMGTLLMIEKRSSKSSARKRSAILYAFSGAVFAALTSILGKMGIDGISSNFASAIRTCIVLIMAWVVVFISKDYKKFNSLDTKSSIFIILSGIATGASWLCYYRALSLGPASHVAPIDKLSIVLTVILSYIFFREKLSWKSFTGLFLIVIGTLLLLIC